ncbi:MAG: hypothetical protein WA949_17450 [Phormidesmis sp.]
MLFNRPIRPSQLFVGFLAFSISILLGIGIAAAADARSTLHASSHSTAATSTPATTPDSYGMVDPIDSRFEASYRIYLNECATCHVALPPAVLPTQTWQTLVTDPAHYGLTLTDITAFEKQLIVNYLQAYSRSQPSRDPLPFKLADSDYFHALHPNVTLPQPLNLRTCASCHLLATTQNYRDLAPGTTSGDTIPSVVTPPL